MIIPILFAAAVAGDALSELRAAMTQLTATAPVHGTFEVTSTNSDSDDSQPSQGKASVGFEISDAGLRVIYARPTLAAVTQESRSQAVDPERQTPVRSGMAHVDALQLAELLDGASMLTTQLVTAQLIDAKASAFRGKPARLVTLKLLPKWSKAESKHMKKMDATLSVWLGEDGVPVAAERNFSGSASFMLMSFTIDENEKWEFARAGDRLIATRYERNQKAHGLGQHDVTQVVAVVRPEQ